MAPSLATINFVTAKCAASGKLLAAMMAAGNRYGVDRTTSVA
jgi:hypothetical protein